MTHRSPKLRMASRPAALLRGILLGQWLPLDERCGLRVDGHMGLNAG